MENINTIISALKKADIDTAKVDDSPLAIFVGGQPGCGKDSLVKCIKNEYPDKDFVVIDADNYRKYFPDIKSLKNDYINFAVNTGKYATTIELALLDYALSKNKNIIHVSTLRATDIMLDIIYNKVPHSNYYIIISCMSVPFIESAICCQERYEYQLGSESDIPRFVSFDFMKSADTGFLNTLKNLEKDNLVDCIKIYKRGNTKFDLPIPIYNSLDTSNKYSTAFDAIVSNRTRTDKYTDENISNRLDNLLETKKMRNASKEEFDTLYNIIKSVKYSKF